MHHADPGNNNLYVVHNKVTTHPKKAKHCSRQMFWEIILPFFFNKLKFKMTYLRASEGTSGFGSDMEGRSRKCYKMD